MDKTFNVRICNKYDTYEAFQTSNLVLKKGEMALFTVTTTQTDAKGNVINVPCVMAKVGNGTSAFNDLPFMSSLSADVGEWAKSATKPVYNASEISGLADYIAGEVEDTNTRYRLTSTDNLNYKLQSSTDGTTWADVTGSTFKVTTVAAGTAAGTIKIDGTDVAITGWSDLNTKVTANTTAIAELNGADTVSGSVAYQVKQGVTTAKSYTDTKVASAISSVYKPGGTKTAADILGDPGKTLLVAANLGVVYNVSDAFTTDATNFVEGANKKYPAGTNVVVINNGTSESPAYRFDILAGFVDLSTYAKTTDVNTIVDNAVASIPVANITGLDAKVTSVVDTELTKESSTLKTDVTNIANTAATSKINDLNVTDTAVAGEVVTAVSESNGKITVTRGTVDIADLAQDASNTITFNCGTATTVI